MTHKVYDRNGQTFHLEGYFSNCNFFLCFLGTTKMWMCINAREIAMELSLTNSDDDDDERC